jgi:outer membrane murein-binding lipoprotein Lpp
MLAVTADGVRDGFVLGVVGASGAAVVAACVSLVRWLARLGRKVDALAAQVDALTRTRRR